MPKKWARLFFCPFSAFRVFAIMADVKTKSVSSEERKRPMISIVRIRIAKIGYFVISVLFCALGAVLILYPELSAVLLCRSLGVLLGVYGVIKLIGYFSKDLYRLAFQFDLAWGILFVALGVILAVRPYSTLSVFFPVTGSPDSGRRAV